LLAFARPALPPLGKKWRDWTQRPAKIAGSNAKHFAQEVPPAFV